MTSSKKMNAEDRGPGQTVPQGEGTQDQDRGMWLPGPWLAFCLAGAGGAILVITDYTIFFFLLSEFLVARCVPDDLLSGICGQKHLHSIFFPLSKTYLQASGPWGGWGATTCGRALPPSLQKGNKKSVPFSHPLLLFPSL